MLPFWAANDCMSTNPESFLMSQQNGQTFTRTPKKIRFTPINKQHEWWGTVNLSKNVKVSDVKVTMLCWVHCNLIILSKTCWSCINKLPLTSAASHQLHRREKSQPQTSRVYLFTISETTKTTCNITFYKRNTNKKRNLHLMQKLNIWLNNYISLKHTQRHKK